VNDPIARRAPQQALAVRRDPPAYVVHELGPRPAHPARAEAWDQAVASIEHYRVANEVVDTDRALGKPPQQLLARVAWRKLRRALDHTRNQLSRGADWRPRRDGRDL
jgi:hypothetical protein